MTARGRHLVTLGVLKQMYFLTPGLSALSFKQATVSTIEDLSSSTLISIISQTYCDVVVSGPQLCSLDFVWNVVSVAQWVKSCVCYP